MVVAFAPKVIIACLRQVVAFAPKLRRLRRRIHEWAEGWAEGWVRTRARGEYRFIKLMEKKGGGNYAVFYFAGKRKYFFIFMIGVTPLPQRALHPTDHVGQETHPTYNPSQSARKNGAGETRRRGGRR